MNDFLMGCIKGFYPYFALPALAVMVGRLRRGGWRPEETLLLLALALGAGSMIVQIAAADRTWYMSRRYLLPFAPVLCGFLGWGWVAVGARLTMRTRRWALGAAVVLGVLLYGDALRPALKDYTSARRRRHRAEIQALAEAIRADRTPAMSEGDLHGWWYAPRIPGSCVLKNAPDQLVYLVRARRWSEYFPGEPWDYRVGDGPAAPGEREIPVAGELRLFRRTGNAAAGAVGE